MSAGRKVPASGRKVRIAVIGNLPTHYRRPLWEALAEVFDADFFFTSHGTERYWSKDHQFEFGRFRVLPAQPPWRFVRTLMRGQYDCILFGLAGRLAPLEVWFAAKVSRTPVILWTGIWQHPRTPFHRLSRPAVRYLYRSADALLVYGPHIAAHVEAESGRREGVYSAPNAIDNTAFRRFVRPGKISQLRQELMLPTGNIAIFVGRLEQEKGLELLFRALPGTKSLAGLMIVGSGSLEDELKRLAVRLGIADRVRFAGYVQNKDLAAYLDVSDFLVLPSITTPRFKEPWGLVANEAMNRGRPVVASAAVGAVAGGLIVDRVTGLVFPERDGAALATAMDELGRDHMLRANLGAEAKRHVLGWSIEKAVATVEKVVGTVLDARKKANDTAFDHP
ncbi:MAG: glycosyltransferase family 4 protein [Gemmatimonadota bacterium]|nr:glycosyltransferase family 4 protein [Gemmatimonadota bacterium]